MIHITPYLNKRKDALIAMRRVVKQKEVDVFVKVMVRKSTTKGPTAQVVYEVSRLVSLLVSKIVHVNLSGHK